MSMMIDASRQVQKKPSVEAPLAPGAASAGKKAAAKEEGFEAQENALKPAAEAATSAGLPGTTGELRASAAFKIASVGTFQGEKGLPAAVAAELMAGIAAEGVSDATSLKQALEEYVDEGRVEVLTIQGGGASYKWLSFYAGDTEVGYIFAGSALKAIVSDGEINGR